MEKREGSRKRKKLTLTEHMLCAGLGTDSFVSIVFSALYNFPATHEKGTGISLLDLVKKHNLSSLIVILSEMYDSISHSIWIKLYRFAFKRTAWLWTSQKKVVTQFFSFFLSLFLLGRQSMRIFVYYHLITLVLSISHIEINIHLQSNHLIVWLNY